MLAFGTQVCGFKPDRSRRIFRGEKVLSTPSFGGEVQPSVPCRTFTACKRTQKWDGSRHFRQNSRPFLAHKFLLPLLRFAHVVSDTGDVLWRELERSNHWSSKFAGLTCCWQQHSVKTFLLRILNDSWVGRNPLGLQSRLKKKKKKKRKKKTLPLAVLSHRWGTD